MMVFSLFYNHPIECGEIKPSANPRNKNRNKLSDIPIRQVNALTVRFVLPSSLTKKTSPLAKAPRMKHIIIMMKALVNICYTPEQLDISKINDYILMSLTGFKRGFTRNWPMTLLAIFGVLLFMRLGFWQLDRAFEKTQRLALEQQLRRKAPITWLPSMTMPLLYQRIKVEGHFLPQVFFLDNQHHQHQFGYHVISPLRLSNRQVILVDRGWINGDPTRQNLPEIHTPLNLVEINGVAYYPSYNAWLYGNIIDKVEKNSTVIEALDTHILSQFLHHAVYPFIIRLDKHEAHGFVRAWQTVSMPPERHYAYAVQWFGLAGLIIILYVALTFRKKNEDINQ